MREDYLASLMLLAGVLLLILNWKCDGTAATNAGILAAYRSSASPYSCDRRMAQLAIADLWLNSPRWLRFLALCR